MELVIRDAKYSDFKGVFLLLKQLWPDLKLNNEKLEKVYRNSIDSDKQRLIVGTIADKIIGFCSLTIKNNLWQAGNLGHVDELIVDNEFRGLGYGKRLMARITEIANDCKCKRIELDTAFHRKEAHVFYETIGYENRAFLFSKKLDN
jgi:glucosamine-phosphate N-acetyltransferase